MTNRNRTVTLPTLFLIVALIVALVAEPWTVMRAWRGVAP